MWPPDAWRPAVLAAVLASAAAAHEHSGPALAHSARTLFFDTMDLAQSQGVGVRVHEPTERSEFALVYDEPWENVRSFGYNSVLDNGTHVLIYYVRPAARRTSHTLYLIVLRHGHSSLALTRCWRLHGYVMWRRESNQLGSGRTAPTRTPTSPASPSLPIPA